MLLALTAGMLSPQQNLPCQDDDPSSHASQTASLFQAAHGERAPEGPVLHRFGLPVTVLQFAWAGASRNCSKGAGYMPVFHGTGMSQVAPRHSCRCLPPGRQLPGEQSGTSDHTVRKMDFTLLLCTVRWRRPLEAWISQAPV